MMTWREVPKRWVFIAVIVALAVGAGALGEDTPPADNNSSAPVWQDNPYGIPVTRWPEADGGRPISYSEWKTRVGAPRQFSITLTQTAKPAAGVRAGGLFCVIVNSGLQTGIQTSLDQYLLDLTADGYTVEVHATSGGTPADMRSFLQGKYAEGMIGAVLIGNLPVAWFESDCWDPLEHEEFPCDLYYMDMDGTWYDGDANGLFDSHQGDLAPEIWIGRLTAYLLMYGPDSEADLVNNYFRKNHAYRTDQMYLNKRALVYIDDDWEPSAGQWNSNVGMAYADRTLFSDPAQTIATDYKSRLQGNYESVLLAAHSSPTRHWFKVPPGTWHSTVDYFEIVDEDPPAFFYNLFACSNARFVQVDYMAGWYIFCDTYGLAAVGSTKTGSMLDFEYFYGPFGRDSTIGEAFASWFKFVAEGGVADWEICWHYGMTLCGDPTLVRGHLTWPVITTTFLPEGDFQESYFAHLQAEEGIEPYDWQFVSGALPSGLMFMPSSSSIGGIPDTAGVFDISICVTDASPQQLADTAEFQLTINYLCGDANNDDAINVGDAVFLITYVFKNGPPPVMMMLGETNCDGDINVGDAVYIINRVFKNGPPPCALCP